MSDNVNLKVLLVSSEVAPYAKSGGLGDVAGSLPSALKKHGVDVRVVFPKYKNIPAKYINKLEYVSSIYVSLDWRNQGASILKLTDNDVTKYLIENNYYFDRDNFYGYFDDCERFAFFTKAALEMLNVIDFIPDIIHFNDWQTGLGGLYLRDKYRHFVKYDSIKSLFTIHNIQYQGIFSKEALGVMDLNSGYASSPDVEFYGNLSTLKAGIMCSNAVSTVSKTYAEEIKTPNYGYGMDSVLRERNEYLSGILNGIDFGANNPETDPTLYKNYGINSLSVKKENKLDLQKFLGLPQKDVPMISIISRLVDQKGLDLIFVAMEELLNMDIQLVVLGTGESRYEHLFRHMAWRAPEKVSANIYFSPELAQRIYGSADIFLMPSLFEPCGLGQIIAMRYGTVPIVRKTGGLADTVTNYNPETNYGNGFVFENYTANGMMWAINEALRFYNDTATWNKIVTNTLQSDYSWDHSAMEYIDLYTKLKNS